MKAPPQELFGKNIKELQRVLGVSLKTLMRYRDGTSCPPPAVLYCIRMRLEGELGLIDPAWDGWVLRGGKLVSPEGLEATPGEVRGVPFMVQQIAAYQVQFRQMELEQFVEQPLPSEEVTILCSGIVA